MKRRSFLAGIGAVVVSPFVRSAFAGLPGGHYLTALDPANVSDPLATTDVTSSSVWSFPHLGESNTIAIFNGGSLTTVSVQSLQLMLSTSRHLANNIYTVHNFMGSNGPVLVTGPAWQSADYGASVIGSNAAYARDSTTGVLVNASAQTMYNGDTPYSVSAGAARLIGGIRPRANGLLGCDVTPGGPVRWDIFNLNNQRRVGVTVTQAGSANGPDGAGTWRIPSSAYRVPRNLNNDTNCYGDIFTLTPQQIDVTYFQVAFPGSVNLNFGVRWNSEVSSSGAQAWDSEIPVVGRTDVGYPVTRARRKGMWGANRAAPVEVIESFAPGDTTGALNGNIFYGGPFNSRCTIEWMG